LPYSHRLQFTPAVTRRIPLPCSSVTQRHLERTVQKSSVRILSRTELRFNPGRRGTPRLLRARAGNRDSRNRACRGGRIIPILSRWKSEPNTNTLESSRNLLSRSALQMGTGIGFYGLARWFLIALCNPCLNLVSHESSSGLGV